MKIVSDVCQRLRTPVDGPQKTWKSACKGPAKEKVKQGSHLASSKVLLKRLFTESKWYSGRGAEGGGP